MSEAEMLRCQGVDPTLVKRAPKVGRVQIGQMIGNSMSQPVLEAIIRNALISIGYDPADMTPPPLERPDDHPGSQLSPDFEALSEDEDMGEESDPDDDASVLEACSDDESGHQYQQGQPEKHGEEPRLRFESLATLHI